MNVKKLLITLLVSGIFTTRIEAPIQEAEDVTINDVIIDESTDDEAVTIENTETYEDIEEIENNHVNIETYEDVATYEEIVTAEDVETYEDVEIYEESTTYIYEYYTIVRIEHVYIETLYIGSGEYYTIYGSNEYSKMVCLADDVSVDWWNRLAPYVYVGATVKYMYEDDWYAGEMYPVD